MTLSPSAINVNISVIIVEIAWQWFHQIANTTEKQTAHQFETGRDETRMHFCWRFVTIWFRLQFFMLLWTIVCYMYICYGGWQCLNVVVFVFAIFFKSLRLLLSVLNVWQPDSVPVEQLATMTADSSALPYTLTDSIRMFRTYFVFGVTVVWPRCVRVVQCACVCNGERFVFIVWRRSDRYFHFNM